MSTMPLQRPATSEQVVETPRVFLDAVLTRLGTPHFMWDLAATEENSVCGPTQCFTPDDDALTQSWGTVGWNWCNPPYANLTPWTQKAWEESRKGAHTAMLVPASTGANWWRDWVAGKAYITFLNGRLTFRKHTAPYPKDLALLLYAPFLEGGSCWWRWKV